MALLSDEKHFTYLLLAYSFNPGNLKVIPVQLAPTAAVGTNTISALRNNTLFKYQMAYLYTLFNKIICS